MLYDWLISSFPNADVELEVYIPKTNQVADVLVEHCSGYYSDEKWAFEFQHSSLSVSDWLARHDLYDSAEIQDFWVLDAETFLKFSKAQDVENARLRKELESEIFSITKFCYFLDLNKEDMIIDVDFRSEKISKDIKGRRKPVTNEYFYHDPIDHSCKLDEIIFSKSNKYGYLAMAFEKIRTKANSNVNRRLGELEDEEQERIEAEIQFRAKEIKRYTDDSFNEETSEDIWSFMKENREDVKDDVHTLSVNSFLSKYEEYFEKIQFCKRDFKAIKESEKVEYRVISNKFYTSKIYDKKTLDSINGDSLTNYLLEKYELEISNVKFVLEHHDTLLDKLVTYRPSVVKKKLSRQESKT